MKVFEFKIESWTNINCFCSASELTDCAEAVLAEANKLAELNSGAVGLLRVGDNYCDNNKEKQFHIWISIKT